MPSPLFKVKVFLTDETSKLVPLKGKHADEVRRKAKHLVDVVRVDEITQIGRDEYLALKAANKPAPPPAAPIVASFQPPRNAPGRGVVSPRNPKLAQGVTPFGHDHRW